MKDQATRMLYKNPFGFEPVFGNRVFVGREEQVVEIKYYFNLASENENYFNLLIVGPSGSGKSSLLNYMKNIIPDKNRFIFININIIRSNMEEDVLFFKEILTSIMSKIDEECANMSDQKRSEMEEELRHVNETIDFNNVSISYLQEKFKVFLTIANNLGKSSLVLLFDDCNILAIKDSLIVALNKIYSYLKPEFSIIGAGYQFIFLGTSESIEKMRLFTNSLKKIELPYFNEKDVKECICSQLKEQEKSLINNDIYENIHLLTCGCPRVVMLFAHFIYREFFESQRKDSKNNKSIDINAVIDSQVLEQVRSQLDTQNIDQEVCKKIKERIGDRLDEKENKYKDEIRKLIEVAGANI